MALDSLHSSNLEQLALKGLSRIKRKLIAAFSATAVNASQSSVTIGFTCWLITAIAQPTATPPRRRLQNYVPSCSTPNCTRNVLASRRRIDQQLYWVTCAISAALSRSGVMDLQTTWRRRHTIFTAVLEKTTTVVARVYTNATRSVNRPNSSGWFGKYCKELICLKSIISQLDKETVLIWIPFVLSILVNSTAKQVSKSKTICEDSEA